MRAVQRTVTLLLFVFSISEAQVPVSLPNVSGQAGTTINIPITVGNLTGLGVTAYQFVVTYDTAIARLTGAENAGTLSPGFMTVINTNYPGQLRVASAGITPIVGSGTLIFLKAELKSQGSSNVDFASFKFNDGVPAVALTSGKITVLKGNQKPVFVSRVPVNVSEVSQNKPQKFVVSAYDPDGGTLTFTWKLNGVVVQTGPDSTYTKTFSDPHNAAEQLVCVFSESHGLKDSTTWDFRITYVALVGRVTPNEFSLGQNYPNPFSAGGGSAFGGNPTTSIEFRLPVPQYGIAQDGTSQAGISPACPVGLTEAGRNSEFVTLEVFDILGREVATLVNEEHKPGVYKVQWDASAYPSGVYFYRLRAGDFVQTRKMVLTK